MFKERDCVKEHAETELCFPDYCAQLHKLLSIIATWIKIPDCGSSPWWHFWKDWQSEFVKAKKRGTNEFICVFFLFRSSCVFFFFQINSDSHSPLPNPQTTSLWSLLPSHSGHLFFPASSSFQRSVPLCWFCLSLSFRVPTVPPLHSCASLFQVSL